MTTRPRFPRSPSLRPLTHLLALSAALAMLQSRPRQASAATDIWTGGTGNWNDPANWSAGIPLRTIQAIITGTPPAPGIVTIDQHDVLVSHLGIAEHDGNLASLTLNGPSLTVIGTVDIAKYNNSNGRLLLNAGNLFAGTIFLSGGGGPGQEGNALLEIHGGSLVTKDIELGASAGSTTAVRIVGSTASAIVAEDGLHIGVYNYLSAEKQPAPSNTELIFDIDAHGVTPLFAWGKTEGRVNFPVPDNSGNGLGSCRLRVNLLAMPPAGDLLLIGASHPCHGAFTDLPEGAPVDASFADKTYEWKLTYRGGAAKSDIMLTDPHIRPPNGPLLPYTTETQSRQFSFDPAVVESAYRQLYRQVDAQEPPATGKVLAFPGAQGYGAFTPGGRGGKILFITNLNDAGPGSLREALETKGPRTVIFRVGGIINTTGLVIHEPFITIAGQTAPGDGICIKKSRGNAPALLIDATHDVILRFLRVRAGNNTGEFRGESLRATNSDNVIIDHCSCSWGNPETLSASDAVDRVTVQWCIASEGNNQQNHAFASIIAGDRSTWHHNLYAHMQSRVPRWGDITTQCDFRNNVLYDWGGYCGYGDFRTLNYVNNYLRKGPGSTQNYIIFNPKTPLPAAIYVDGNFLAGNPDASQDNWKLVDAEKSLQSKIPFPAPPIHSQSAEQAFATVLKNAGATIPKRDSVDARAVSDAQNGTGKIINNENDVGGWPAYASGIPQASTANDGIPDDWKKAHALPINDPTLANKLTPEGYTELELYLNSIPPTDLTN